MELGALVVLGAFGSWLVANRPKREQCTRGEVPAEKRVHTRSPGPGCARIRVGDRVFWSNGFVESRRGVLEVCHVFSPHILFREITDKEALTTVSYLGRVFEPVSHYLNVEVVSEDTHHARKKKKKGSLVIVVSRCGELLQLNEF